MGGQVVMVFDFDKTMIECDSDDWVVHNLGLAHLFNALLPTIPYNSLMDRMMEELHLQGTTIQEISECLKEIPLSPNIISAIKSAHASGCDLRIVSDANTFFIETILKHHGVLHFFSEINTNLAFINEHGRLKIRPFHDSNSTSHGCSLCPPNLCKGRVIERIQSSSSSEKRFIYVGDGKNDVCPSLKLTARDYVMPRKDFPLWEAIRSSGSALVKARVSEWSDWEELERGLVSLVSSEESRGGLISEEFLRVDCKPRACPLSMPGPLQKAVRVPH